MSDNVLGYFHFGDPVVFGVGRDGIPVWNIYEWYNVTGIEEAHGVVCRANGTSFTVQYHHRGSIMSWVWPQPSTMKGCWEDSAYIKHKEE